MLAWNTSFITLNDSIGVKLGGIDRRNFSQSNFTVSTRATDLVSFLSSQMENESLLLGTGTSVLVSSIELCFGLRTTQS